MSLNNHAFELLKAEVLRCCGEDFASQVQKEIALKRLEKLRSQSGAPLTLEELRGTVSDLFPNFSERVLKAAAAANRPSKFWGQLQVATIAIATVAGSVWFLNLPYPMIRFPVSRVAPIVLLPSFMSMDSNYRQAIALVEQSDQLVNQATSAADFELGATKVKKAQSHLDALPVWFLGYYPQAYCAWSQCTWRFTLDEFEQARKQIARMDAKLFQEKNAQTQLGQAEQSLGGAKQQYQESPNLAEKQTAIAQWQQAIDTLEQIPRETLAGRMAQTKLAAYERDFQQVVGFTAGNVRSGNLIQAAKAFATVAQAPPLNTPRSVAEWEKAQGTWQDAIVRLEEIKDGDPDFLEAQTLLAGYKDSLRTAKVRQTQEQTAVEAFEEAQQLQQQLVKNATSKDLNQISSEMQAIESKLAKIDRGTTVYSQAQTLLAQVRKRLK